MSKKYSLDNLIKALVLIDNEEDCKKLLDDICTIEEVNKMAQRLEAAQLLLSGYTYEQVIKETKISSTTLSRVSRCIQYGDGGYKTIIDKLNENE